MIVRDAARCPKCLMKRPVIPAADAVRPAIVFNAGGKEYQGQMQAIEECRPCRLRESYRKIDSFSEGLVPSLMRVNGLVRAVTFPWRDREGR